MEHVPYEGMIFYGVSYLDAILGVLGDIHAEREGVI